MNKKLWTKVLASLLVMTLTFTNFILLGIYANNSYATTDNLEQQQTSTNNENVTFDAYFKDETGKITHTKKEDINSDSLKMYISIGVKKGYLKNAQIQVLGENATNSNLKVKDSNEALEYVEKIDESSNTITLKQINSGTQVIFEIPVEASKEDSYDLSDFSKLNNIKLTGTYVGDATKEVKIQKTIQTRNEWIAEAQAYIEQELVRFIPYQVGEKVGTIIQTRIKTGLKNNTLPIKETKLTISAPIANTNSLTSVVVTTNGTMATNGKSAVEFTKDSYTYDSQTKQLVITVENEPQNNQVVWKKQGIDEYIITYVLNEKIDTLVSKQLANVQITAYSTKETIVNQSSELAITQQESIGEMIGINITATDTINKGYLYTKVQKETMYDEKVEIDIPYPEIVDELAINQSMDYFVNANGEVSPTTISGINYAYYKTTKISKANFEKILGAEGSIQITTLDGKEIANISKEMQLDNNGDYVVAYTQEYNEIVMKVSAPVETGKLEIRHQKALKGKTDYSKEQVESFKTLKLTAGVVAKAQTATIANISNTKDISLIAPSTKMEVTVSKQDLSTVVTNENVEIRAILDSSDISCDLFKNPTIEVVLPNYISKLNIRDINLLFDNELSIKDYNTYVNENGNIVIVINVQGEQTTYNSDKISKGANIIVNADITLKQLTPTKQDVINAYIVNENVTTYEKIYNIGTEQKGYSQTALNTVAPVGIVTTNGIEGYNSKNETVTSISGQEQVGKLDAKKEARMATMKMNVINNYQNVIKNVNILGRIPTQGNKNVDTSEDFGSNIAIQMASNLQASGVDASNIKIYYSANQEATKDVTLASNGWTQDASNIANMKSYLIVIETEIATGTILDFSYNIAIPENIGYNMQAYSNYVVFFENVKEEGIISEKALSPKVGLETGDGPELEIAITSDVEGKEVEEGKIITYTMTVKNVGKSEVKNVIVSGKVPDKTIYTYLRGSGEGENTIERTYDTKKKEYSEKIDTIAVNEEKTISYQVKTKDLLVGHDKDGNVSRVEEYTIENNCVATVEGYDVVFNSKTIQNKLVQGYLNIEMKVATIPERYARSEKDEVTYIIHLENVNSQDKKNLTLKTTLPEGLTFKEVTNSGKYDEKTRQIVWNIENFTGKQIQDYQFKVIIDELPNNTYEKVFNTNATVTGEKQVESNTTSITVQKAKLTIKQSTDTKTTVNEGDTITYHFEVKNEGKGDAPLVEVVETLPKGVKYESTQYSLNGKTYDSKLGTGDVAKVAIGGLKSGETLEISIKAIADNLEDGVNKLQVTNKATVKAEGIAEVTSNEITHTIMPRKSTEDPSMGDNTPEEGTHTISGIVWQDTNQNGKRDDDEARMANIPVMLINADNGKIVSDITTGKEKKQETGKNGEYTFSNLQSGNYIVVFLYDSSNYGVTIYKQAGINDDKNSDAVQMNVVYEDVSRVAGVSDKLKLENEDIGNIDLGLINSLKFDLKLNKVISKITVTDSKETKTYEYKDEKLAKLDLNSKTANETTIMIEYKIRVTNEGGIAGYAKKIVDYMPSDMKFNSELNKDWYTANNGTNLYNASLANTLIKPGETKEITLLLTKKITDSNMGIINNTAEIAESYNDLGIKDIDSVPANKVQSEDDISNADAIIGTKTGEIYLYILLTITTISILGVGIYLINKKVLKRV